MKLVKITKYELYDDNEYRKMTFVFCVGIGLINIKFYIPKTQMLNFIAFLLSQPTSRFEIPEFRCGGSFDDILFTPKKWRDSILNNDIGAEDV